MPRGGTRPGAGRKPDPSSKRQQQAAAKLAKLVGLAASVVPAASVGQKAPDAPASWPFGTEPQQPAPDLSGLTPLDYLLSVVRDPGADQRVRIQAASIAAPFLHVKKGEGGKKEGQAAAAKQVAGRFSASAPPKLVAAGGRKV